MTYRIYQEAWETVMNAFMPFPVDDPRFDQLAKVLEQVEIPYIRDDNANGVQLEFKSRKQFKALVKYEILLMDNFERWVNEIPRASR